MVNLLSRISVLLCAVALLSVGGCGSGDKDPPGVVITPDASYSCVDDDHDGFGTEDCIGGVDCDDTNPDITDGCFLCLDNPIQEGCECEPQPGMECVPPPIPHADGLLICREGTRFCRDGFWTACEPLGEYILVRNP